VNIFFCQFKINFGGGPGPVEKIPGIDILFRFLSDTPAPQFGCVKPDVVPEHVAPGAQYDPQDDPSNPTNVNDKCY